MLPWSTTLPRRGRCTASCFCTRRVLLGCRACHAARAGRGAQGSMSPPACLAHLSATGTCVTALCPCPAPPCRPHTTSCGPSARCPSLWSSRRWCSSPIGSRVSEPAGGAHVCESRVGDARHGRRGAAGTQRIAFSRPNMTGSNASPANNANPPAHCSCLPTLPPNTQCSSTSASSWASSGPRPTGPLMTPMTWRRACRCCVALGAAWYLGLHVLACGACRVESSHRVPCGRAGEWKLV